MLLKRIIIYCLGYLKIEVEGFFIERFINSCRVKNILILGNKEKKDNTVGDVGVKLVETVRIPVYEGSNIKCDYFLKIKPVFEGNNIHVREFPINFNPLINSYLSLSPLIINESENPSFDNNIAPADIPTSIQPLS